MRRIALIVLATASPVLLLALLVGGEAGGWLLAVTGPLIPVALMALAGGAGPPGRRERLWLAAWLLSLEIGCVGMMLLRGRAVDDPSALPSSTWIMLVALGAIPLVLVAFGYAALFPGASTGRRQDGRSDR